MNTAESVRRINLDVLALVSLINNTHTTLCNKIIVCNLELQTSGWDAGVAKRLEEHLRLVTASDDTVARRVRSIRAAIEDAAVPGITVDDHAKIIDVTLPVEEAVEFLARFRSMLSVGMGLVAFDPKVDALLPQPWKIQFSTFQGKKVNNALPLVYRELLDALRITCNTLTAESNDQYRSEGPSGPLDNFRVRLIEVNEGLSLGPANRRHVDALETARRLVDFLPDSLGVLDDAHDLAIVVRALAHAALMLAVWPDKDIERDGTYPHLFDVLKDYQDAHKLICRECKTIFISAASPETNVLLCQDKHVLMPECPTCHATEAVTPKTVI